MEKSTIKTLNKGESLNIKVEIEKYLRHWKWFLLGFILSLSLAFVYLRYSSPKYLSSASILIKDNKKAGLSTELEAFKDLGIVGGGSVNNTDNEIEILKSRKVIGNLVDSLNLGVTYYIEGRVITSEVYQGFSPIKIEFIEKSPSLELKDTILKIQIVEKDKFDFIDGEGETISSHVFGSTITSNAGVFKILRNGFEEESSDEIIIRLIPRYKIIDRYRTNISISPVNKNSSVLILSLKDPVREKADDILNELVRQYNLDAIRDKNQVSEKTIQFINARLKTIGKELALIDDDVKDFKNSKEFTGLPIEAQLALQSLTETNKNIVAVKTHLSLVEWIDGKLKGESTQYDLLPASLGFENSAITVSIANFNELVLQRNRVNLNVGKKNPLLLQIESQIEDSRSSLLRSLSNVKKSGI